jgi:NAD(P)H-hydrate epimerase
MVSALLPERPQNSHKGTYGRAVVAAGSINYTGAAALAGAAAYRAGAGLVTMAVPQAIYPILAAQLAEATWLLLPHELGVLNPAAAEVFHNEVGDFNALLLGPGMGREKATAGFLRSLLRAEQQPKRGSIGFVARASEQGRDVRSSLPSRLVIDADGLNLLSDIEGWHDLLPAETVVTPHPGEMARLTGLETSQINADRIGIARVKASEWGVVVVLKGAFTVIAEPGGRVVLSPFATDALATAGTGDVLAGCIVGLMAQGLRAFDAAVAATYMHGLAGKLAGQEAGTRSVVAGDVLRALPAALTLVEPPL